MKKLLKGLLFSTLLALVITGCGKKDDTKDPTDPTSPSISDTTPTDPTDPTNPTDPTTPTDPTEPTDPVEPDVTLESIAVTGNYDAVYEVGETLNLEGVKLTITYSNDTSETIDVTQDMISSVDMTTAGIKEVTVTYEGKTTTFYVEVIETQQVVKMDPTVEFSIEAGAKLVIGKDAAPTVTVTPSTLEYTTYYTQNDVSVGTTFPTEIGTYAFVVEVTGNEEYNDAHKWVTFSIVPDKLDPEVTVSINNGASLVIGKDAAPTVTVAPSTLEYKVYYELNEVKVADTWTDLCALGANTYSLIVEVTGNEEYNDVRTYRWFYLKDNLPDAVVTFSIETGSTLTIGKDAAPTFTVTEGLSYTAQYEQDEKFYSNEFPTEPGTYALVVKVTGNENYNGVTKWIVITLVEDTSTDPEEPTPEVQVNPTVKFSINNGASLIIGKSSAPTVTVPEGVEYVTYFELNEKKVADTWEELCELGANTYSFILETRANSKYLAVRQYRWFYLKEDKTDAKVTFSITSGTTLTIGKDAAPTFTVTEGLSYTAQYEQDEKFYSNEFPTEPGTYALVVKVTGNSQYNGVTKWVVFTLVENTEANPT